jgi:putative endonuclease
MWFNLIFMTAKSALGQRGEQLAAAYLQQHGYTIVTTNWHCSRGELDIVARKNDTLVFVEVRTRHADSAESAFESIRPTKQSRVQKAAYLYLAEHKLHDASWRIDIIAVALPRSGSPLIEHIEDALDW